MRVKDLIRELQYQDPDAEVLIKGYNTRYVDSIRRVDVQPVRSFWGSDKDCVIIRADHQVGQV